MPRPYLKHPDRTDWRDDLIARAEAIADAGSRIFTTSPRFPLREPAEAYAGLADQEAMLDILGPTESGMAGGFVGDAWPLVGRTDPEPTADPWEIERDAVKLYTLLESAILELDSHYQRTDAAAAATDGAWSAYKIHVRSAAHAKRVQQAGSPALTIALGELHRLSSQREESLAAIEKLKAEASDAAEEARASAERAAQAATDVGAVKLGEAFTRYGGRERRLADGFRFATFAALGSLIVAVLVLWISHAVDPLRGDAQWSDLTYKVSVVLALAAASTYLGRQAAHHRRIADWADSIAIQLESFPAFIDIVKDDVSRADLFSVFSRRVLGSPPEVGASKAQPADTEMMRLILDAVKTTRPS